MSVIECTNAASPTQMSQAPDVSMPMLGPCATDDSQAVIPLAM